MSRWTAHRSWRAVGYFAGSLDGKLYVLDLAKGTLLRRFDLGGALVASPAVGGDRLVVGTARCR